MLPHTGRSDGQEAGPREARPIVLTPIGIGLSCVRLLAVEGAVLRVAGLDILDGTPLLDLKPYVPFFEAHPESRAGWLDQAGAARTRADARFAP